MLNQKKIEIFLTKIRKSLAKQFLEIALNLCSAKILQMLLLRYPKATSEKLVYK